MNNYSISAKPTYYKNRLFRSRLEARWACFFDFLRWENEYEPEPFKTWSPDFLLQEFGGIYLEVKPYGLWTDENLSESLFNKIKPYSKLNRCGIIADEIVIKDNAFYIGKYINHKRNKGDFLLTDITIQYTTFNKNVVKNFWTESKNQTMYLKPI